MRHPHLTDLHIFCVMDRLRVDSSPCAVIIFVTVLFCLLHEYIKFSILKAAISSLAFLYSFSGNMRPNPPQTSEIQNDKKMQNRYKYKKKERKKIKKTSSLLRTLAI